MWSSFRTDGVAVDDGGVTPLALQGGVGGQVGLAGGDHLGGVLDGLGGDTGEDGGDQGLGVEGGGDAVEDGGDGEGEVGGGGDGESRVLHTEAGSVGDVADGLEDAVGVDVGVSAGDAAVGVAHFLFDGVEVGVAVVEVAELVLGVE